MEEKQIALRQIAKGGGVIFVGYVILGGFDFLYKVIVARYLSPQDYGVLSLGLVILGVSVTVSRLGFSQAFKKYIPEYRTMKLPGKIKSMIIFGLGLSFLISLIIAFSIYLFSGKISVFFSNDSLSSVLKIFSFVIPFYTVSYLLLDIFLSFKRVKERVIIHTMGRGVLIFVLTLLVIFLGGKLKEVCYIFLFSYIISVFISFFVLETRIFSIFKNELSKIDHKRILSFSIPLMLVGFLGTVLRWSDTFFIGYFREEYYVGLYNAAYPLAFILLLVIQSFNSLFYPVASELYTKRDFKNLREIYGTVTRWIFLLTFPLFLLLIFFSKEFISTLFGAKYVVAYKVLVILSFGTFTNAFFGAVGILLQVFEKQNFIFRVQFSIAFLNIAMNILLIPLYGIEGAAFATSFSMILWNVIFFLKIRKILSAQFFLRNYLKYAVSAFFSLFVFFSLDHFISISVYTLFFKLIFYAISYTAFILLTNSLMREDLDILIMFGRKSGLNLIFIEKLLRRFLHD